MPTRKPEPLLRINCFEVLIGDQELGFAEVSRLTSETPLDTGSDRPVHRFATVVLRRALTPSTDLYDWRRLLSAARTIAATSPCGSSPLPEERW